MNKAGEPKPVSPIARFDKLVQRGKYQLVVGDLTLYTEAWDRAAAETGTYTLMLAHSETK